METRFTPQHRASLSLPIIVLLLCPLLGVPSISDAQNENIKSTVTTTGKWEKEIRAFEELDKKTPPPSDAALFIGSSSFRLWSTMAQDFSEIPTINRGFGGSEIADSTQYADRIVLPYKPRMIVMFAGGNDLEHGKTPKQVTQDFKDFVAKVRTGLPKVPIVYISINPTIRRWKAKEKTLETNRLISKYATKKRNLFYIDSYSGLLGADGTPQKSLLREDGLHLNSDGYKLWLSLIKPSILKYYTAAKQKS